ncbi:MAG: hypothetical protein OZ934_10555 [Anaerolineae bacterium]|nr:hypothetical protein [Anaerolineae bacterium]
MKADRDAPGGGEVSQDAAEQRPYRLTGFARTRSLGRVSAPLFRWPGM